MKTGNWIDKQVSLYNSHRDTIGHPATFREVLFYSYTEYLPVIEDLRKLELQHDAGEINDVDHKVRKAGLKSKLPCFAPSALLRSRATQDIIELTGILQLDFDYVDIQDYDIQDLKECVFSLPFIAFCGLSCSGKGFYALALIEDPKKQREYADHIFNVLKKYSIKPDTTKGRNANDLRYVSFDENMLVRENPVPLKIIQFKAKETPKPVYPANYTPKAFNGTDGRVSRQIEAVLNCQVGQRWATVQKAAFTLGGINDPDAFPNIINAIENNSAFAGEEEKYFKCAEDCFNAGAQKPL